MSKIEKYLIICISVSFIACIFIAFSFFNVGYNTATKEAEQKISIVENEFDDKIAQLITNRSDYYYAEASIIKQVETAGGNWVVYWNIGNDVFVYESCEELSENYQYLLTMYTNYSSNINDDEIVVIWRTVW